MHPTVTSLAAIFRLNTELLLNCLRGMGEEQAGWRGEPPLNSIAFLVTHLIGGRHHLARLLGAPLPSPFPPVLTTARTMDDAGPLPALSRLMEARERISAHLAVEIERIDTGQLARHSDPFPGSDGTLGGAMAFLAQHESYHLGQIALRRREAGLPPMSYYVRPREPGRRGA